MIRDIPAEMFVFTGMYCSNPSIVSLSSNITDTFVSDETAICERDLL
jgi:hypothetical protein